MAASLGYKLEPAKSFGLAQGNGTKRSPGPCLGRAGLTNKREHVAWAAWGQVLQGNKRACANGLWTWF